MQLLTAVALLWGPVACHGMALKGSKKKPVKSAGGGFGAPVAAPTVSSAMLLDRSEKL